MLAAVSVSTAAPAYASCNASPSNEPLTALDRRVESDPVAAIAEVTRRLAAPRRSALETAELYAIDADGYDLLDDDSHARDAVEAARTALGELPDGEAKSALEFRLQLIDADTPRSASDMADSVDALVQLERGLPARSLNRACLLIIRSRLNTQLLRDEEATADGIAAYQIAGTLHEPKIAADAAYQLAMTYLGYGLLPDADELARQAADYHRSAQLNASLSNDLYIHSDILNRLGRYEEGLAALAEARALNQKLRQEIDVAFDDERQCAILLNLRRLGPARQSCLQADATLRRGGRVDIVAMVQGDLAQIELLEGQPQAAVSRLNALLGADTQRIPRRTLPDLYRSRADAFAKLGRFEEALRDMREVSRLAAASAAEQQSLKAERVSTHLRADVVQQEKAALESEMQRERLDAAAQARQLRLHRALAAAAGLICCLIAYLMWYRARQERLQHQQKEMLLKEIHHRVKNNLQIICSLLNLQSRATENSSVQAFADESQSRVRAMALVHEHLYQSARLDRVRMDAYLRRLIDNIAQGQGLGKIIRCDLSADRIMLTTDQASTCGLIVNEIITNAFKHAFPHGGPGHIAVSISATREHIVELEIKDDGVGYTPAPQGAREGFGLRLVDMLVGQLEGAFQMTCGNGTQYRLRFRAAA